MATLPGAGALTRVVGLGDLSQAEQRMALTRQGSGMNWQRQLNWPISPWQSMLQDPLQSGMSQWPRQYGSHYASPRGLNGMGMTGLDPRWMAFQNMQPNSYDPIDWMGFPGGAHTGGHGNGPSIDPAQLLQLLGLPLHRHQRRSRTAPMNYGYLGDLLGGNHHHSPRLDVDVNLYHHPGHGHRHRQHFRPDSYCLSDSSDYDTEIEEERSYVRRRPRRSYKPRRWRSWSPGYPDLDRFDNWCWRGPRGRPRDRMSYRLRSRARDGSYTDREFTLR